MAHISAGGGHIARQVVKYDISVQVEIGSRQGACARTDVTQGPIVRLNRLLFTFGLAGDKEVTVK